MDGKLGVQHGGHHSHNGISKPPVTHHAGRRSGGAGSRHSGGGGGRGKGIKVVYISSPMKLTASAEDFRAIVQELTGRDSNVADHDLDGAGAYYYAGAAPSSSSSSSSYSSSFGRASPTAAGATGALSAATMVPATNAGPVRRAPAVEYVAAAIAEPPLFQQSMYDQTAGTLLYGQDYW